MGTTDLPLHPELAFSGLAGGAQDPRSLLRECRDGEALGFGTVFLSERFNVKEVVTLSGAAAGATERLRIATGVTNHTTRHPIVTASYASTMHQLTGGRFELGLGRGIDRLWDAMGLPRITTAQLEDIAGLYRRLWRGEMVLGHDGPAGSYPFLHLDPGFDLEIPLLLSAFGPNSLALAGRVFDGVILHTFSCYLTVGDWLDDASRLNKTVGRLATYLQGYGDLLVRTNGWDPAALERFRADELVSSFRGALDATATTAQLEHVAMLIPDEWLSAAAVGPAAHCAEMVRRQVELGADGVILHGATPAELAPIIAAYGDRAR